MSGQEILSKFCPLNTQDEDQRWDVVCCKLLICMAVQVALLTIYDMCKAVDRGMTINGVTLLEKHGGKSGRFIAPV